jgi:cysteinyl-tRNA synthetase
MSLMIYNTYSRKKEPLETIEPGVVRMYVCGPTVYDRAHVGHAMSSIVFDVIRRWLEYRGYRVIHVMNYTDVDDKVIQRARELGVDSLVLAEGYLHDYNRHLRDLHVLPATINPQASMEIEHIIEMVTGLIEKNHAYQVDGDVYFRVASDEDYGKLSGRKVEEMQAGARLMIDERKEDPADFALWKSAKPGEPSWESPWGLGRPGWHIECSAMSLYHLGEQIDIHGGGTDLIFPHHENEIAQTESLTGKPFVRYWVHNGMLQLQGEKMSKSIGNVITVEEFLESHAGDVLRMVILNASYRKPLKFNDEVISQAESALQRLRGALRPAMTGEDIPPGAEEELAAEVKSTQKAFEGAMDDDFNTAEALGHLFELVRNINLARDRGIREDKLQDAQDVLKQLAGLLGLELELAAGVEREAATFIDMLVGVRQELRKLEQWALADLIRDRLAEEGIILEDVKDGTTWRVG